MNKPLTIDELKALKVGDWVWVISRLTNKGTYRQVYEITDESFICDNGEWYQNFCNYPLGWLVYKNKEMAESKGNIERLNEVYDYLYDCLNNAATCIAQKDTNVAHVEVDAWLEFDLVIDLSNARYFDNTTMEWKELRGEK